MHFQIDNILAFFKLVSVFLAGFFAIFGLLIDYKDKATGRITNGGKTALIGIVLSTSLGLATQLIEQYKATDEARASAARSEKLLVEISKSLQPLRNIRIYYSLGIDVDDPEFSAYKSRLISGVKEFLQRHPKLNDEDLTPAVRELGLSWESVNEKNEIMTVHVAPDSPFQPNEFTEPLAYSALNFRTHVCLRKFPAKDESIPCAVWDDSTDLRFLADREPLSRYEDELGLRGADTLSVDPRTLKLTAKDNLVQIDSSTRSNGRMLSVPDLLGAEIFIFLENMDPRALDGQGNSKKVRTRISKSVVTLTRPVIFFEVDGHEYVIRNAKTKIINGKIYLIAKFPDTAEAMTELE